MTDYRKVRTLLSSVCIFLLQLLAKKIQVGYSLVCTVSHSSDPNMWPISVICLEPRNKITCYFYFSSKLGHTYPPQYLCYVLDHTSNNMFIYLYAANLLEVTRLGKAEPVTPQAR